MEGNLVDKYEFIFIFVKYIYRIWQAGQVSVRVGSGGIHREIQMQYQSHLLNHDILHCSFSLL